MAWLAGKRQLRPSTRRRLEQIGGTGCCPCLDGVLLERLNAAHCAMVFDRIEAFNEEIAAAADEDRPPVLDGDARTRPLHVGIASQHRVYAALREFLNHAWKQRHVITFNPVYAVELEPEETPEGQRWSAAQAARFLAASAADPLGLMFRLILSARPAPRRGGRATVVRRRSGRGVPHRRAAHAAARRRDHREQAEARRAGGRAQGVARRHVAGDDQGPPQGAGGHAPRASTAWQDDDLIFCREDGSPWPPGLRRAGSRRSPGRPGCRSIKLHEGRHSAASPGAGRRGRREDPPGAARPRHRGDDGHYTHVLADAHLAAAEAVARLVEEAGA